ncbi:hypothetical protein Syun_015134 [Stephania yunnanensis]|uniref:Uncharacterized protein n=1 Tax=Stephania yunnanensis TaxID=152371 RepID=A0AAP0PAA0_9MAGN
MPIGPPDLFASTKQTSLLIQSIKSSTKIGPLPCHCCHDHPTNSLCPCKAKPTFLFVDSHISCQVLSISLNIRWFLSPTKCPKKCQKSTLNNKFLLLSHEIAAACSIHVLKDWGFATRCLSPSTTPPITYTKMNMSKKVINGFHMRKTQTTS